MKKWIRKQIEETQAERETVAVERSSIKALIHDVSDVVIQLRVATEDLERALIELSAREEGDD